MPQIGPERQAAIDSGARTYETGKVCRNGHVAPRYTETCKCVLCIREGCRRRMQKHYAKNPGKHPAVMRERRSNKELRRHELDLAQQRRRTPEGLRKDAAKTARRREARKRATPPWANRIQIVTMYKYARSISQRTGVQWHVDHEVPLIHPHVCGLHVPINLRCIPADENLGKRNEFHVAA